MQSYIVVGGGLAGLCAANALADAGHRVKVLEQSERLGGRAITQSDRGYLLNLGAHALYRGGRAHQVLRDWKIPFQGRSPDITVRSWLVDADRKYTLFADTKGLLRTRLFSLFEKLEAARLLGLMVSGNSRPAGSMAQWIEARARSARVREFAAAFVRVSTYTADLDDLSASAALAQFRLARNSGVLYLDGGWQTLIDGLAARARALGVEIRCGEPVDRLEDLDAEGVILAVAPRMVEEIAGKAMPALHPVRLACLDLGLRKLPEGGARFALAIDRPFYLSVHSEAARLAAPGQALVHIGKYLGNGAGGSREELESFADQLIPGWRAEAELVRYLPNMTVTHAIAAKEGRPDVDAAGLDGVALAGDWVGPEGMLADAAVASALRAAKMIQVRRRTHAVTSATPVAYGS